MGYETLIPYFINHGLKGIIFLIIAFNQLTFSRLKSIVHSLTGENIELK